MQNTWLEAVKKLHAIAQSGLAFNPEPYDKERYEEISDICASLISTLVSIPVSQIKPTITQDIRRYVTPQVEVRGAIFHDQKVLLVKEKQDGKWTLPGGYADVGLSATENVIKEIREESGLVATVVKLYALRHKAKGNYHPDIRDFYKLMFLCETDSPENICPGMETSDVGFFSLENLPELSSGRTIVRDITDGHNHSQNHALPTELD